MRGRNIKIMIADSQPLCLLGLKSIVESQDNMKVVAAASTHNEIISSGIRSNCDVLIIDPKQLDHSGLDTIRMMKEQGFEGKVLLLVSDLTSEIYQQARKLKVDGILLKTVSTEKLIRSVNEICRGEALIDQEVEKALIQSIESSNLDLLESEKVDKLSLREYEILRLVASGNNNKSIANILFISEKTVKNHLTKIFRKLEVLDRVQAALFAVKHNIR